MRDEAERDVVEVPPSPARPVRLHPFRGLHLSPTGIGDPATVRTLARPHRDIARRMRDWEARGRLLRDVEPAIYLHEYSSQGMTVRGLVGAMELSSRARLPEERALLPHEAVHPKQAHDLAERMEQLGLNPAPILLVHRARAGLRAMVDEIARSAPLREYDDRTGQHHRIWAVTESPRWHAVAHELADAQLLIADGHHRYSAYLKQQEAHPGTGWDRGLVMVVDQDDTPLYLGPIHRTLAGCSLRELEESARIAGARVRRRRTRATALAALAADTWVATDGDAWLSVTDPDHRLGRATVQHLHEVVLARHPSRPQISYHHSAEDALAAASRDTVGVLLPAPEPDLLEHATLRGHLLPEKATSFQPKPSIGSLMRAPTEE